MRFNLKDKVVLVTGASSGIGLACAEAFASAGARLALVARRAEPMRDLARSLPAGRTVVIPADLTSPQQRADAVARVLSACERIDVLVNNAGWAGFGDVVGLDEEHVRRMVELNIVAPVALTRLVLPAMIARREGQIINIASIVGYQPIPRMTVYSATKAFVLSFSTGLRMELARTGVDVISVAPGSTRTPFFENAANTGVRAVRLASTQYTPERVARAIVRASIHRRREVLLSASGRLIAAIRRCSHRTADAIMLRFARFAMPPASDRNQEPRSLNRPAQ